MITSTAAYTPTLVNPLARPALDLDGKWAYLVDPYDFGFYDYRLAPWDRTEPITGGYALNKQPANESELIEYAFDDRITLQVPRD